MKFTAIRTVEVLQTRTIEVRRMRTVKVPAIITVEFDVIRTVALNTSSSQKTVELPNVWTKLAVSPPENMRTHN